MYNTILQKTHLELGLGPGLQRRNLTHLAGVPTK